MLIANDPACGNGGSQPWHAMTLDDASSASCSTLEVAMTGAMPRVAVPLMRYVANKPRLRAHPPDVAIVSSLWSETFCFTVHEALTAGAFVVARRAAGNVWLAVAPNVPDQSVQIDNEAQLFGLFKSGDVLVRVAQARRFRGRLTPTGNTADFLAHFASEARDVSTKIELAAP